MCVSKSSCLRSYVKTKCARFMLVRRGTGDPKHITIRASTMKGLLIGQASSTIHYWPKTTQSCGNIFSREIFVNKSLTLNCAFYSGLICKMILKSIQFLKQRFARSSFRFARSSFDTIWGHYQMMSSEVSMKISWNYPQIVSSKDCAKDCFKN